MHYLQLTSSNEQCKTLDGPTILHDRQLLAVMCAVLCVSGNCGHQQSFVAEVATMPSIPS